MEDAIREKDFDTAFTGEYPYVPIFEARAANSFFYLTQLNVDSRIRSARGSYMVISVHRFKVKSS